MQVICWKSLRDHHRDELLRSCLLAVSGRRRLDGKVRNPIAEQLAELTSLLERLGASAESGGFR